MNQRTRQAVATALQAGVGDRILGIDLARGLAVIGMVAAHTVVPAFVVELRWTDPATWAGLVNGRSAILFVLLAGISLGILTRERAGVLPEVARFQDRRRVLVRAVYIGLAGGLLMCLGTPVIVILPVYAMLYLLVLPVLRWSAKSLFVLTGTLAVLGPIFVAAIRASRDAGLLGDNWFLDLFAGLAFPIPVYGVYLILGLALSRLNLRDLRVTVRMLLVALPISVIGYLVPALVTGEGVWADQAPTGSTSSVLSSGVAATPGQDAVWVSTGSASIVQGGAPWGSLDGGSYDGEVYDTLAVWQQSFLADQGLRITAAPHSSSYFEMLGSGGFAVVVLALCLLATRLPVLRIAFGWLSAVGSMPLTAYAVHLLVLYLLGTLPGTVWFGEFAGLVDFLIVAGIVILFATVWRYTRGRGPLEQSISQFSASILGDEATRLDGASNEGASWRSA